MSDVLKVGRGPSGQRIEDAGLPLAVGVRHGRIAIGDAALPGAALWLGRSGDRLFAQPETGVRNLFLNGTPLVEAAWLAPGDTLRIRGADLAVEDEDGLLVLVEAERDGSASADPANGSPSAGEMPPRMTPPRPRRGRRRVRMAIVALLGLLAVGVGLVLAVSPVRVTTEPAADRIDISGFPPAIPFLGRFLALPGSYTVIAEKAGYRRLERPLTVALGSAHDLSFRLRELPGYLTVRTTAPGSAAVAVDGRIAGETPLDGIELEAGTHQLLVSAPRYRPRTQTVEIAGKGARQSVEIVLEPAWGRLVVESVPAGATVRIDGAAAGETPLEAEPLEGRRTVELAKEKYKPATREIFVIAGQTVRLAPVELEKSDGAFAVSSTPDGATVTVDGDYKGIAPVSVAVAADREHEIVVAKAGFRNAVRKAAVGPEETRDVAVALEPEYGTVFINARPPDAQLAVNGKPMGAASRRLRLTTAPHRIEISREGYEPFRTTLTPKPGVPGRLTVTLRTVKEATRAAAEKNAVTAAGQKLVPVWIDRTAAFDVGSSRGEPSRRSNEARYRAELTRSFFIGEREVTNSEFRAFRASHDSGRVHGVSLDGPDLPAVSVSWDDAARYLNWLSAKDGLPAAYAEEGGRMVPVSPMTRGYRLPTEAEWVYAARYEAGRRAPENGLRYPWGDAMPPKGPAGNFADETARNELPVVLRDYRDGFVAAAPVGQFAPNRAGLYDMGGNVSEWCHDVYDIRTLAAGTVLRDPMGPERGPHHVVRGSSWRHGSVAELRYAWRDFAGEPRIDLGFRIARYAD